MWSLVIDRTFSCSDVIFKDRLAFKIFIGEKKLRHSVCKSWVFQPASRKCIQYIGFEFLWTIFMYYRVGLTKSTDKINIIFLGGNFSTSRDWDSSKIPWPYPVSCFYLLWQFKKINRLNILWVYHAEYVEQIYFIEQMFKVCMRKINTTLK